MGQNFVRQMADLRFDGVLLMPQQIVMVQFIPKMCIGFHRLDFKT